MTHGLDRERPAHQDADVDGLGDLGVRRALVEDLLDSMIDSVEAVLRDRHCQRRELLVLLRDRAVGEDLLAQVAEGGVPARVVRSGSGQLIWIVRLSAVNIG